MAVPEKISECGVTIKVERRIYTSGNENMLFPKNLKKPSCLCDFVAWFMVLSA